MPGRVVVLVALSLLVGVSGRAFAAEPAATRQELIEVLELGALFALRERGEMPLEVRREGTPEDSGEGYVHTVLVFRVAPGVESKALLTLPTGAGGDVPLVICLHGHDGGRDSPYNPASVYQGFGLALARAGFATLSVDLDRHEPAQPGLSLVADRLWELVRCVDLATSLPGIDPERIGVAGLSLGGQMSMWLAAIDTRVSAAVVAGAVTTVEHLRVSGSCPCWEVPGFAGRFGFGDVLALIAPRPLQIQHGRADVELPVVVTAAVTEGLAQVYADSGAPARLDVHLFDGVHEIEAEACLEFLADRFGRALPGAGDPPAASRELEPSAWETVVTRVGLPGLLVVAVLLVAFGVAAGAALRRSGSGQPPTPS
jgi:hypothetical protein